MTLQALKSALIIDGCGASRTYATTTKGSGRLLAVGRVWVHVLIGGDRVKVRPADVTQAWS